MLILSRKLNERIMIGDQVEIAVVEIRGDQVKLGIAAPREVKIYRQEVYDAIQQENIAAVKSKIELPQIEPILEESDDHQASL